MIEKAENGLHNFPEDYNYRMLDNWGQLDYGYSRDWETEPSLFNTAW